MTARVPTRGVFFDVDFTSLSAGDYRRRLPRVLCASGMGGRSLRLDGGPEADPYQSATTLRVRVCATTNA